MSLFDITRAHGQPVAVQAHERAQLEEALQGVEFQEVVPDEEREEESMSEETKADTIERIKALTNDASHIHEQALRLAGLYLQAAREEVIEQEAGKLDQEDGEIYEACSDQLEKIGDEIVRLGVALELQSKDNPCSPGDTYLLSNTPTATYRVTIDGEQVTLTQALAYTLGIDEAQMLTAVLRGVKVRPTVPHRFSSANAAYHFFYEPAGAGNSFSIMHTGTRRSIGMEPRIAFMLLKALTGKTEHLTRIGKGGPSLVSPTRRKAWVHIQEVNTPPSSLFDTSVAYPSDALPEWFVPLQSVVEDSTFTSMDIHLGDVLYHISLVKESEQ